MPVLKVFKDGIWQNIANDNVGVSSWNDLTDKPFYEAEGEFICSDTVTTKKPSESSMRIFGNVQDFNVSKLVVGDWYTVEFNGDEYTCQCLEYSQSNSDNLNIYLGNLYMKFYRDNIDAGKITEEEALARLDVSGIKNTEEPFCLYVHTANLIHLYTEEEGTYNLTIKKQDLYHIHDKFISDSIARTSEVVLSKPIKIYYEYDVNYNYSDIVVLDENNTLVKISENAPELDFFIGKCLYIYDENVNIGPKETVLPIVSENITVSTDTDGTTAVGYSIFNNIIVVTVDSFIFPEPFYKVITKGMWVNTGALGDKFKIGESGKLIDESLIPNSIARTKEIDWDRIPNKPFYMRKEKGDFEISYDPDIFVGDTYIDLGEGTRFVLVSDETPSNDLLKTCDLVMKFKDGDEIITNSASIGEYWDVFVEMGIITDSYVLLEAAAMVVRDASVETPFGMAPKTGTYFLHRTDPVQWASSLHSTVSIQTIEEELIPDTIARTSEVIFSEPIKMYYEYDSSYYYTAFENIDGNRFVGISGDAPEANFFVDKCIYLYNYEKAVEVNDTRIPIRASDITYIGDTFGFEKDVAYKIFDRIIVVTGTCGVRRGIWVKRDGDYEKLRIGDLRDLINESLIPSGIARVADTISPDPIEFYYEWSANRSYDEDFFLRINDEGNEIVWHFVKISDEVPDKDFILGKGLYITYVTEVNSKNSQLEEVVWLINQNGNTNGSLVEIDSTHYICGGFIFAKETVTVDEPSLAAIPKGVWVQVGVTGTDNANTMQGAGIHRIRIGEFKKTIDPSLISGVFAKLDDIPKVQAQVQADWAQTDKTAPDFIKNKPEIATDDDITDMLSELNSVEPVTTADGSILTSSIGEIYSL